MPIPLGSILRNAVAIVDDVTKDVQPKVTHRMWVGQNGFGAPIYEEALRDMVVERKQRLVQRPDGKEVLSKHLLTHVGPIPPNGAAGRQEPVDPRDVFVLPDGTTGPSLATEGIVDKGTGAPFLHQVWLGTASGTGSV